MMGMKHTASSFTTNRLRAARRLTGPVKSPLWAMTSYSQSYSLGISMITSPNRKPSVKFTCPLRILKLPKTLRSSWHWLKGLWGSTGGLYFPKAGSCLTLIVSAPQTAEIVRNALGLTGLSFREHRHEFTIRNHDGIMTFLCNAGMPLAALDADADAMIREARSRASRESNYDTANIMRAMKAAHEQTELARRIISLGMLDVLPESLREVVNMRIDYPEEPLGGLGKKLQPPITKSAVKYRWKKIQTLITQIQTEEN